MPNAAADDDHRATPLREDGATFEMARVRSGRSARLLIALGALVFGGLVALNALDQLDGPADRAASLSAVVPAPQPSPTRRPNSDDVTSKRFLNNPEVPARATPAPQYMALDVRPAGSLLFVHGDVFSIDVREVVVTIQDSTGTLVTTRTVRLQGGSTAFRLGANARFDTLFEIPDELMGDGVSVHADAYDGRGRIVAALERPVETRAVART
jgi:hypothetical protein